MNPRRDPDRPKVPDAVEAVRAVYARPDGGAGCCLHVVVDDMNTEDSSVDFCLSVAAHAECKRAAEMLRQMTRSQRIRAIRRVHGREPISATDLSKEQK